MTDGVTIQDLLREQVAEEVRALLARKMMTGADLAAAIGRSPMYVSRRIRGEVAFDLDDMQRIAAVLDVSVHDLIPPRPAEPVRRPGDQTLVYRSSPVRPIVPTVAGTPFPRTGSRPSGHPRKAATRPGSPVPATRRRPVPVAPPVPPSRRTALPMSA